MQKETTNVSRCIYITGGTCVVKGSTASNAAIGVCVLKLQETTQGRKRYIRMQQVMDNATHQGTRAAVVMIALVTG